MAWKELFAEPGLRLHFVLRLLIFLLVIASFWPPARITFEYWIKLNGPLLGYQVSSLQRDYHVEMNIWVRGMSAALGSLLLLGVAMRAAGSITGERSRQTLDELLTTPLSNDEIIHGKWLGALLGMRRGWLWLGSVYLVGLASGGLNFFAGILTIAAWFGFACFFASLGLWFSANCRNSFRSTTLTMICSAFCLCLHWAATIIFCFLPLSLAGGGLSHELRWLVQIQAGFTPPFTLALFSFWDISDEYHMSEQTMGFVIASIVGLAAYSLAGWALLRATVVRFAFAYNRTAIRQPLQLSQNSSGGLAKPAE
jgi:ABC-type transport system involved in multi-copper enzyme maturation permease subunit